MGSPHAECTRLAQVKLLHAELLEVAQALLNVTRYGRMGQEAIAEVWIAAASPAAARGIALVRDEARAQVRAHLGFWGPFRSFVVRAALRSSATWRGRRCVSI